MNHTAKLGGGEIALRLLVRHLDRTRFNHAALLFEDGPLCPLLAQDTDVHVLHLSEEVRNARKDSLVGWSTLKNLLGLPLSVLRIRAIIRGLDVDYVHTNSLKADILGGIAGRLAGKRVVWHVRDRIAPDYLPLRVVQVFRRLARIVPHGIIANSRATLESLELPSGHNKPVAVVHDGLDLDTVADGTSPSGGPLVVGLIGRIAPWKGQDVFLHAIDRIQDRMGKVRFEIIGTPLFGEHDYERSLWELSTKLGLDHCVTFCGFVTDIHERIAKLDLVVHASIVSEPFGQVIIEGMAAGKAVIATRGGGVSEIVEDAVSGVLVPMKDASAMGEAMLELLEDPVRRAHLGAAARKRVEDHFRIEYAAAKVLRFYEELSLS